MTGALFVYRTMENSDYLIDAYVTTRPGEPYRLLPFGRIYKAGKAIDITPEYAARFKLPHFRPAVKLGSHDDTTPAGGHITGLEVRADGLYALTEMNDKGAQAMNDGAYRYHSPEVLWEGGYEDPKTGELIPGPLIVGDALLHNPHLGEAAALYSVEPFTRSKSMTDETVQVPKGLLDRFMAIFDKRMSEPETPEPAPAPVVPDEFKAQFESATKERDEFKARLDAMEAEKVKAARVEHFGAQLKETKVSEGAEILAAMSDEQAAWVVTQFKALSAQVNESALFSEKGTSGGAAPTTLEALDAAIKGKMADAKLDYNAALIALRQEKPDLFNQVRGV